MFAHFIFCLFGYFMLVASSVKTRPLEGVELRCCTIEEAPMVIRDPTAPLGFRGLAFDYLRELQDDLGFKCSEISLSPHSFTTFIENLHKCEVGEAKDCPCDLGVAGFGINANRFSKADFLPGFSTGSYRVITYSSNTSSSGQGWIFFNAFDPLVWLLIFLLIFCLASLKLLDPRGRNAQPYEELPPHSPWWHRVYNFLIRSDILRRLRHSVGSTLLKFIGQLIPDAHSDRASARTRCIDFLGLFLGLCLVLAFEAATTASLLQETTLAPFRHLDDFKTCRIPPNEICIPAGGAEKTFFDNSIATQPCYTNNSRQRYVQGTDSMNPYEAMLHEVSSKKCKYGLASESTLKAAARGAYCGKLNLVGRPFFRAGGSFVLPKNSRFTEIMSKSMYEIISRDVLPTLDDVAEKHGECPSGPRAVLGLNELRYFFLFAFGSFIVMLIAMIIYPPRKSGAQSQDDLDGVHSSQ